MESNILVAGGMPHKREKCLNQVIVRRKRRGAGGGGVHCGLHLGNDATLRASIV